MTGKHIAIFVIAILAVSVSLYSAFKPAPIVKSEQLTKIEDAKLLQGAEKFSAKVRRLANKRSLRELYKVSSEEGALLINLSVKELRAFKQDGWKLESLFNTEKKPTLYTCKVVNSSGQKGKMMLNNPDGKHWKFFNFEIDKQESKD